MPIGTLAVKWYFYIINAVPKSKADIVGPAVIALLRERRQAARLSMNILAERAGVSHSEISRVEHGKRKPTMHTLLRMTQAMEIDLWPLVKTAEQAYHSSLKTTER